MYRWFPLEDIKGHGNRLHHSSILDQKSNFSWIEPIKDVMTKKYLKTFLVQCIYCALSMLNTQINKNWIKFVKLFHSHRPNPQSARLTYFYCCLKIKYKFCQLTSLSLMLCRHCELLVLLALGGCAQSFRQRETGSSSVSDWVGGTAACIHVLLFHEPWLTC